jgi:inosose dehydratase
MTITRDQIALNALQWINLKQPADGPKDKPIWLYNEPSWRSEQPKVHQQVKDAGFDAVMIEVLATQTLQNYQRMLDSVGLKPAPGFVDIGIPENAGLQLTKGSAEWVHWFDKIRRRAEETNFLGLDSVFISPAMIYDGNRRISEQTAVGAYFDQAALDRQLEILIETAEVLKAEGVRAGLHNHIGSLIETEYEIDYAMDNTDPALLGASLDIGHLAWAGIDYRALLRRHKDRLLDLHIKDIDQGIADASRAKPSSYYEVADQRFFLEPGLGDLELDGVIADLGEYGFDGWVIIEVDRASMEPFESAKVGWTWVTEHITA